MKAIGIFCGSSSGENPLYIETARYVGKTLAAADISLVYGGGKVGLMGAVADACLALAEYLTKDDRTGVFRRLASRLRVDALKLHRLLALIPDEAPLPGREHTRRQLGVLQALRLALLQHMFLRAVSVPAFSRANSPSIIRMSASACACSCAVGMPVTPSRMIPQRDSSKITLASMSAIVISVVPAGTLISRMANS